MLYILGDILAFLFLGLILGMMVVGLREFRRMVDRVEQGQMPRTPLEETLAQILPGSRHPGMSKKESQVSDG